ncbi:N-acetyltransferase [uncultured Photobacterium sp.]|uniref:GNAT family N-acetyltransferase n=1 Tax=uncultured Photobacterium sp. TaxID=173973 RepID=UPI002615A8C5|nr:N-acetyltransferase [uncultured Photobacterium sp.]
MAYFSLTKALLDTEHICCAFSDKKCAEGYQLKKNWLAKEFDNGYRFIRLDERAKVFIEYGPAEAGWVPVSAPNYLLINCFWVSGKYKGHGHGKALLNMAINDARAQGKDGLVTVVGAKKCHFMSDGKWLLRQGIEVCATTDQGFNLLVLKINPEAPTPSFNDNASVGNSLVSEDTETGNEGEDNKGIVVYYSNRCPFTEYHVSTSLVETASNRGLPLKVIKFETAEQAQLSPTPATIFSLFYNGQFVTTDVSVCMDSRFDKAISKIKRS